MPKKGLGLGSDIGVWFTDFWLDYTISKALYRLDLTRLRQSLQQSTNSLARVDYT
jgi:hypothetical protein